MSFAPLRPLDGYLALEDYGLIGEGTTAALVGRDGAILWLCVPHFDVPPLFCRILDAARGGASALQCFPEEVVGTSKFVWGIHVRSRQNAASRVLQVSVRHAVHAARLLSPPLPKGTGSL